MGLGNQKAVVRAISCEGFRQSHTIRASRAKATTVDSVENLHNSQPALPLTPPTVGWDERTSIFGMSADLDNAQEVIAGQDFKLPGRVSVILS